MVNKPKVVIAERYGHPASILCGVDRLEQLMAAQRRVLALHKNGTLMTSKEARRAVNRLITLIRGATQEELQAFDVWKKDQEV